ncbi:MAG TPA: hypothetical protein VLF79_02630 [Candidatus Saccharimonadales bacterium]|nr:hypothetical protein [Candidatus Saccharimonadales bacterium]
MRKRQERKKNNAFVKAFDQQPTELITKSGPITVKNQRPEVIDKQSEVRIDRFTEISMVEYQEQQIKKILSANISELESDQLVSTDEIPSGKAKKTFAKTVSIKALETKFTMIKQKHVTSSVEKVIVSASPPQEKPNLPVKLQELQRVQTVLEDDSASPVIETGNKILQTHEALEKTLYVPYTQTSQLHYETTQQSKVPAFAEVSLNYQSQGTELDQEINIIPAEEITDNNYDIFIAVIYAKAELLSLRTDEENEVPVEESIVTLNRGTKPEEKVSFEEFLARQPTLEVKPNLESLSDMTAAEAPLVDTLVQLAVYLSEASEEEAPVIRNLVIEIEKELSAGSTEGQPVDSILTKEVTQKLFNLLQKLGYDDPERTLIKFFDNNDLGYMIQAIKYLYLLCNNDNRQEMHHLTVSSFLSGSSRDLRITSSIFNLIAEKLGVKVVLRGNL